MTEQRVATARMPQLELLRVMATVGIFAFHLWTVIPLSSEVALVGAVLARLPLLGTLGVIGLLCYRAAAWLNILVYRMVRA
jgi:hypothetical protein